MPPSPDRSAKPLLAVAAALLAGGLALAVIQPGDLGDDEDTAATATTATTATTAAPTSETTATTGTTMGTTATTVAPSSTATTVAPSPTATSATTATTAPGSGLGTDGASRADDGTAETGIESMLGPGLALAAAAALLRRSTRRA